MLLQLAAHLLHQKLYYHAPESQDIASLNVQVQQEPYHSRKPSCSLRLDFMIDKKRETRRSLVWQREKDSNPHKQSQSLSCYPYTIPLFRFVLRENKAYYITVLRFVKHDFALFSKKLARRSGGPLRRAFGHLRKPSQKRWRIAATSARVAWPMGSRTPSPLPLIRPRPLAQASGVHA